MVGHGLMWVSAPTKRLFYVLCRGDAGIAPHDPGFFAAVYILRHLRSLSRHFCAHRLGACYHGVSKANGGDDMPMVYCSKCGKLVSSAAGSCCRCGEPIAASAELERAELRRMRAERLRAVCFITAVAAAWLLLICFTLHFIWH